MIKREVLKQLTKFTYFLERIGYDDEMRGLKIIDQVHVLSGEDSIRR